MTSSGVDRRSEDHALPREANRPSSTRGTRCRLAAHALCGLLGACGGSAAVEPLALGAAAAGAGPCARLSGDAELYCVRFEAQHARMGDRYKGVRGSLAWNESRVLRAYVEMYQATRNTRYIDRLIEHIDAALAVQDIALGEQDGFGISTYGWSVVDAGATKPYRFVVHSGMVLYPIVRLIQLVRTERQLSANSTYKRKAAAYLTAAKRVVAAHNFRWRAVSTRRTSIRGDEGFYFWACNDPVKASIKCWNLPHNQQLALGSALLVLYQLTGDAGYRDKAKRLGRVFWRDLRATGGRFRWHYWWGDSLGLCGSCDKYEDMGHGALDIEFVDQAFRQGFNIGNSNNPFPTKGDMVRFARVFADALYQSPTRYADRIDGSSDGSGKGRARGAGLWLDLAGYDSRLYDQVRKTFEHSANGFPESNDRLVLLGYAKLTRWATQVGH